MTDRSGNTTAPLVKALAGASFGLGLAELVAPGKVAAIAGVDDTTVIITHHLGLDQAPHGYEIFKHKRDGCTKVVLHP